MTIVDWFGAILSIIITIIITAAYVYAFRPKNKEKFEECGKIPLDDD